MPTDVETPVSRRPAAPRCSGARPPPPHAPDVKSIPTCQGPGEGLAGVADLASQSRHAVPVVEVPAGCPGKCLGLSQGSVRPCCQPCVERMKHPAIDAVNPSSFMASHASSVPLLKAIQHSTAPHQNMTLKKGNHCTADQSDLTRLAGFR